MSTERARKIAKAAMVATDGDGSQEHDPETIDRIWDAAIEAAQETLESGGDDAAAFDAAWLTAYREAWGEDWTGPTEDWETAFMTGRPSEFCRFGIQQEESK